MISADTITRNAWADYLEKNRRANRQYHSGPWRVTCQCGQRTESSRGICIDCRTTPKDRP